MSDQAVRRRHSLEDLTGKQFQVLEHLAQHKTSKQIARDLNVAQNTVDKHLAAVRRKWNTADRYQTARVFQQLREGCEKHPPRFSAADEAGPDAPVLHSDLPKSAVFQLADALSIEDFSDWESPAPKGLLALDDRFGKLWRIVAIPVLALLALMVLIFAVTLAQALSDLL